ncbi:hypothetical protein EK21DRAFT_108896 [Setomelanomma holmii]|uniref:Uncharacterized protein n=1 Tax=Setomelanomma holmii TaxID=210430 RepID=A0A9P4HF40_9PLEO|nr:hypothetical protein EK21DRAFT_108896 [Setomelanomma holmii]
MSTREERTTRNPIDLLRHLKRLPITIEQAIHWLQSKDLEQAASKALKGHGLANLQLPNSPIEDPTFTDMRRAAKTPREKPYRAGFVYHDAHLPRYMPWIVLRRFEDSYKLIGVPNGEVHHDKPKDGEQPGTLADTAISIAFCHEAASNATYRRTTASQGPMNVQNSSRALYKMTKIENDRTEEYQKAASMLARQLLAWPTNTNQATPVRLVSSDIR